MGGSIGKVIRDEPMKKKKIILIFKAQDNEIKNFKFKLMPLGKELKLIRPLKIMIIDKTIRLSKLVFSINENEFPLKFTISAISKQTKSEVYHTEERTISFNENFVIILDFANPLKIHKGIFTLHIEKPQLVLKAILSLIYEKYLSFSLMIYFFTVFNQTFTQEIEYNQDSDDTFNLLQEFSEKINVAHDQKLCVFLLFVARHDKTSFISIAKLKNPEKILENLQQNLQILQPIQVLQNTNYEFLIAYAAYCCSIKSDIDYQIQILLSISNENTKKNCLENFVNINNGFNKKLPLNIIAKILPFALSHLYESLFIALTRNISENYLLRFFQSCDEIIPIENIPFIDAVFQNRIIIIEKILEELKNASDKLINIFSKPFFLGKIRESIVGYLKEGNKYFPTFMKNKLVLYLESIGCVNEIDQIERLIGNKLSETKIVYENLERDADLIVYLVEKTIKDHQSFENVQRKWKMAFDEYLISNFYEKNELLDVLTVIEKSNSASNFIYSKIEFLRLVVKSIKKEISAKQTINSIFTQLRPISSIDFKTKIYKKMLKNLLVTGKIKHIEHEELTFIISDIENHVGPHFNQKYNEFYKRFLIDQSLIIIQNMPIENFFNVINFLTNCAFKQLIILLSLKELNGLAFFSLDIFEKIYNFYMGLDNTCVENILAYIEFFPEKFKIDFIKSQKVIKCTEEQLLEFIKKNFCTNSSIENIIKNFKEFANIIGEYQEIIMKSDLSKIIIDQLIIEYTEIHKPKLLKDIIQACNNYFRYSLISKFLSSCEEMDFFLNKSYFLTIVKSLKPLPLPEQISCCQFLIQLSGRIGDQLDYLLASNIKNHREKIEIQQDTIVDQINIHIKNTNLDIEEYFYIMTILSKYTENDQFFITENLNTKILENVLSKRHDYNLIYLKLFEVPDCYRKYTICSNFYRNLYIQQSVFRYVEAMNFFKTIGNLNVNHIESYVKKMLQCMNFEDFFSLLVILKKQNFIAKNDSFITKEIKRNVKKFNDMTLDMGKFLYNLLTNEDQSVQEIIFNKIVLDFIYKLVVQLIVADNREWTFFAIPLNILVYKLEIIHRSIQYYNRNHKDIIDQDAISIITNISNIDQQDSEIILSMLFCQMPVYQFFKLITYIYENSLREDKRALCVATIKKLFSKKKFIDEKSLFYICDNIKAPEKEEISNIFFDSDLKAKTTKLLITLTKTKSLEKMVFIQGFDEKISINLLKDFFATGKKLRFRQQEINYIINYIQLYEKNLSALEFIEEISNHNCKDLKNIYSHHISKLIINADNNKKTVENLVIISYLKESYIKTNAIDIVFNSFEIPTLELVYENSIIDVKSESLFHQLIKRGSILFSHNYMKALKNETKKLRNDLCNKRILVEKFILIMQFTDKNRRIFNRFLDYSCDRPQEIDYYTKKIEEYNKFVMQYFKSIDCIEFFIDLYCKKATDCQDYKDKITIARNFSGKMLKQLTLPKELSIIKTISLKIFPINDIKIYKEQYVTSYIPDINIKTIRIFRDLEASFNTFSNDLKNLFNKHKKIKITDFNSVSNGDNFKFYDAIIAAKINIKTKSLELLKDYINYNHNETLLIRLSKTAKTFYSCFDHENEELQIASEHFLDILTQVPDVTLLEYKKAFSELKRLVDFDISQDELIRVLNIVELFSNCIPLCNLFKELQGGDFNDLHDALKTKTNSPISKKDLESCKYIWEFQRKCINKETFAESIEIFLDPGYTELQSCLMMISGKEGIIRELQNEMFFNEEVKKDEICSLVASSCVNIKSRNREIHIELEGLINGKVYNYQDLIEFKDRALFYSNIQALSNKKDDLYEGICRFVAFAESIIKIYNFSMNLISFGKESILSVSKYLFPEQFDSLNLYLENLINEYTERTHNIETAYKNFHMLTYLNPQQLSNLIESIYSKDNKETYHLLNFMHRIYIPNLHIKSIEFDYSLLHELGLRFKSIKTEKSYTLDFPHIYIENNENIRLICVKTEDFTRAIISISMKYSKTKIQANQVFFCHCKTQWPELLSFLCRILYCKKVKLFIIINCEKLSLENQTAFIDYLNLALKKDYKLTYKIVLISKELKSIIYDNLMSISNDDDKKVDILNEDQLCGNDQINEFTRNFCQDIFVVTSSLPGLGKSYYIRYKGQCLRYNMIELNISGIINYEVFNEMLESLNNDPVVLSVQINHVDDMKIVNEFITSLALFKQYYTPLKVYSLNENTKVYIEFANCFQNMLYISAHISKYIQNYEISSFSIYYIIPNDDFNLVSSYLNSYQNGSINKFKIDPPNKSSCYDLINNQLKDLNDINHYTVQSFIKIMSFLIKNFEKWPYTMEVTYNEYVGHLLGDNKIQFENLRSTIFKSLLDSSKEFTLKCIKSVKSDQIKAETIVNSKNYIKQLENAYKISIRWEETNHFAILFAPSGEQLVIYRKPDDVPQSINDIYTIQDCLEKNKSSKKISSSIDQYKFKDYSSISTQDLIEKILCFADKRHISIENLKNYILTPDNFVKMCLILAKAFSGIPIIIMGETGCGKTSLIRFLIKSILHEKFELMNIHTGTTYEDIKNVIRKYTEKSLIKPKKRYWVFFDEFNTSDYVGTISNIIVEKKFEGKEIPENVKFVAACNPYRLKSVQFEMREDVGLQKSLKYRQGSAQLIHIVKPLPYKIIEFVSDFGSLQDSELYSYAELIIRNMIGRKASLDYPKIVCCIHKYYSETDDVSSVSLRDVVRFAKLYNWFRESISQRKRIKMKKSSLRFLKEHKYEPYNENDDDESISLVLSITHCYYLRLSSLDHRREILKILEIHQSKIYPELEAIIKREQYNIISRFRISEEIAINEALSENIYAIIPCLMVKIPVFLCGKPGCSKSLSVQLIFSNLQGQASYDDYFQTLPDLYMVFYQGSDTCTSEGIIKVFEKANEKFNKNQISVVVFDEIGLAEVSIHNPLKVLHSLLENENIRSSFIGISNWRLDASKMNRALYLSRFDPNEKDIEETGNMICKSLPIKDMTSEVKKISQFYFKVKQSLKGTIYRDFYGLRDFYCVVKMTQERIKSEKERRKEYMTIISHALMRNFGGISETKKLFTDFIKSNLSKKELNTMPKTLSLIKENLTEETSRYLMIIAKKELIPLIIKCFISNFINKDYTIITGSNFEAAFEEKNCFNLLSNIVQYMEKGYFVLFHNADSIYSSLYDLFNQNFTKFKDRKYCRVGLGAHLNPRCLVHQNFKAIVFIENSKEKLQYLDPPFLNRFEKHMITLEDFIDKSHIIIANKIEEWVKKLTTINDKQITTAKKIIIPVYERDFLLHLVFMYSFMTSNDDENLKLCLEFLIKVSTTEILLLSDICCHDKDMKDFVRNKWIENHIGFELQIENIITGGKDNKLVVVTYDNINIEKNIRGSLKSKIHFQKVKHFKVEQDIKMDLDNFNNSDKKLYLLEIVYEYEEKLWGDIFWIIEDFKLRDDTKMLKPIIIVVKLLRYSEKILPGVLPKGWDIIMYEDLLCKRYKITESFYSLKDCDFIENFMVIKNNEADFPVLLKKAFRELNFDRNSDKDIDKHINKAISIISSSEKRRNLLLDKIKATIKKTYTRKVWIEKVFFSLSHSEKAMTIHDIIDNYVAGLFCKELISLLNLIERKNAMDSFISPNQEILDYFEEYFKFQSLSSILNNSMPIVRIKKLTLPFIFSAYDILDQLFKSAILDNKDYDLETILSDKRLSKTILFEQNGICNYDYIRKYVIKDIAKIILSKASVDGFFSIFALSFLNLLGVGKACLGRKITCLLANKHYFQALCNIFMVGKSINFISKDMIKIKINHSLEICKIINEICLLMVPGKGTFIRFGGVEGYFKSLKSLVSSINTLKNFELLSIDSGAIVDLWGKVFELNLSDENLRDILNSIKTYGVSSKKFIDFFIKSIKNSNSPEAFNVKSQYYSNIIRKFNTFLNTIIDDINQTELWKFSGCIIQALMIKMDLINTLKISQGLPDSYFILNTYADIIDKKLNENIKSAFAILLSDYIVMNIKNILETVSEEFFNNIIKDIPDIDNKRPLVQITYLAFIKAFIDEIAYNNKRSIKVYQDNIIEKFLYGSKEATVYNVYYLKCVKIVKDCTVKELMKNDTIASSMKIKCSYDNIKLEVKPIVANSMAFYENYLKLEWFTLEKSSVNFNKLLPTDNPYDILGFLLYFINHVYIKHKYHMGLEYIQKWYEKYEKTILKTLGIEILSLIKCFITNFPKNSPFYLDTNDKNLALMKKINYCFILAIVFAFKNNFDPISSMFFNEKSKSLDPSLIEILYCPGSEMEVLYQHFKIFLENFDNLNPKSFSSNYSKGSFNKCSCGYMYIIANCGGPMQIGKCEYCGLEIGGLNHHMIVRPGHVNFSDNEAKEYLNRRINDSDQRPGLKLTDLAWDTSIRNMTLSNSFQILRLIITVTIAGCSVILPRVSEDYQNALERNFKNIEREKPLKIINGLSIYHDQLFPKPTNLDYVWLISILSDFPVLMTENKGRIPLNQEIRNIFEYDAEKNIISKDRNIRITEYKNRQINDKVDLESFINETAKVDSTLSLFFRIKSNPSENDMLSQFQTFKNKHQYKILGYFFNDYENIMSLNSFYPIIKLSNYMLKTYNHKFTRTKAHMKSIKNLIEKDSQLKSYFEPFVEAMKNIKFPVRYNCFEVTEKLHYKDDSSLNNFFIEISEAEGKLLAAVLKTLAETQNNFLSHIFDEEYIENQPLYIVRLAKKRDIIYIPKTKDQLIKEFSICNPNYGSGQLITYDFKGMEDFIIDCARGKKIFNVLDFRFCTYKNEIFIKPEGDILIEMRESIRQVPLTKENKRTLKIFFENIEKNRLKYKKLIEDLKVSIEKIIDSMKNKAAIESLCLYEIVNNLKDQTIIQILFEENELSTFKIVNIIEIYEIVEKIYFRFYIEDVPIKYKELIMNENEAKKLIETFYYECNENDNLPSIKDVKNAIMRLMLRKLTLDIQVDEPIHKHIVYYSLWNEENCEKLSMAEFPFPRKFEFRNICEVYEMLSRTIKALRG
ncbi:hypothetical protein SteCoe_13379 [Stentor coeruleus]|uniref:RZ-type domain-containing protein n=1 Tax=Stentor coeruleus TaxID=5963 RepID=A0A1R2C8K5_9CILI|nr:hypothetical protein SteCoe_13379 [Stentor coeruleus]